MNIKAAKKKSIKLITFDINFQHRVLPPAHTFVYKFPSFVPLKMCVHEGGQDDVVFCFLGL